MLLYAVILLLNATSCDNAMYQMKQNRVQLITDWTILLYFLQVRYTTVYTLVQALL